jgi:hypothetical protein
MGGAMMFWRVSLSLRFFTAAVLAVILLCSGVALLPRLSLERKNLDVALIADYRDITPMAREAGISAEAATEFLREKGISGLMVRDFTIDDFQRETTLFVQGLSTGPDYEGLKVGQKLGIPMFYRVAPGPAWQLRSSLETLRQILSDYPGVALVAPSGDVALGYPDMKPLASLLKEFSIPVPQVEFSRQLGAVPLNWLAFPRLIPLHSVTNDEIIVRRIDRATLHERFTRAAVERSVRLLMTRPPISGSAASSLEHFGEEISQLAEDLRSRGFFMGWPKTLFAEHLGWHMSWLSALACSLTFLLSIARYGKRVGGLPPGIGIKTINLGEMLSLVLLSCVLALIAWKVAPAARLIGALTTAFAVTEGALIAMSVKDGNENNRHPWAPLLEGFFFVVIGGLAVAALFSEPIYMLRLMSFSGVKLTLTLPPLLLILHDMRRRVHPESLSGFLSRPPLWGEFFLGVALLGILGLAVFRSDNVRFTFGVETKIRDALERFLIARPRNREVFIGYPCLLLYFFAVKAGFWARYREILRIGVVLGFASVINSFCHYHTPLFFILLREFHGLWVGTFLGVFAVLAVKFAALPLYRKFRFLTR